MEKELMDRVLKLYQSLGKIPYMITQITDEMSEFEYKRVLKLIDETIVKAQELQLDKIPTDKERYEKTNGFLDRAEAHIEEIKEIYNKYNKGNEV